MKIRLSNIIVGIVVVGVVVGIIAFAAGWIELYEGRELQEGSAPGGESSKPDEEESWGDWMYRMFYPKTVMNMVYGEEEESTKLL